MNIRRWAAERWQGLAAAIVSVAGIGVAFLPWLHVPATARTGDLSGLDSTLAIAWFERNLKVPASVPDVPDATVTLVLFGLVLFGLWRNGLDRPEDLGWGWVVTAGIVALGWFVFLVLIAGGTQVPARGGRVLAAPGLGLWLTGGIALLLLAVALAPLPVSSADATYRPRST